MVRSGHLQRYDVINYLIKKYNYKTYLEIGVQWEDNWSKIICEHKIGVDPERGGTHRMTSDDFFEDNKETFDIVFVDGLHHYLQAYQDVLNSLNVLNDGGIIIMHDIIPSSKDAQIVPRITKHWNGDVWKAFIRLRSEREDLQMKTIQTDCGLGIIKKGKAITMLDVKDPTYEEFEPNRKEWLNAITCDEFLELY